MDVKGMTLLVSPIPHTGGEIGVTCIRSGSRLGHIQRRPDGRFWAISDSWRYDAVLEHDTIRDAVEALVDAHLDRVFEVARLNTWLSDFMRMDPETLQAQNARMALNALNASLGGG